jgi:hypothetical protein
LPRGQFHRRTNLVSFSLLLKGSASERGGRGVAPVSWPGHQRLPILRVVVVGVRPSVLPRAHVQILELRGEAGNRRIYVLEIENLQILAIGSDVVAVGGLGGDQILLATGSVLALHAVARGHDLASVQRHHVHHVMLRSLRRHEELPPALGRDHVPLHLRRGILVTGILYYGLRLFLFDGGKICLAEGRRGLPRSLELTALHRLHLVQLRDKRGVFGVSVALTP